MTNKQQKKRHMTVPVSDVIVLPQVRKTFETENIIELANDIAVHGIIQPPIVGVLSKEEMVRHLKLESIINGTSLSIKSFRPGKDGKYYRLIAGERRYRAHMHLLKKGCEKCQLSQRSGQECYLSHFGSIMIEVRACVNIGAKDAKSIQFRENNHKRPPLHEEAYAFRETFECFKAEDSSYTLKAFAEFAGVGVDKVGRALAYTHLPDIVREVAETELISFSHAVEFKKFAKVDDEKEYLRLVQSNLEYLMLHPRVKLEDFKKRIRESIELLNQASLFHLDKPSGKNKRRVVAQEMIPFLRIFFHYARRVKDLQKRGLLGKGKIFSGMSPNGNITRLVEILPELIPDFNLSKSQIRALEKINLDS